LIFNSELDLIGQAHTGTGKTAAFALPILELIDSGELDVEKTKRSSVLLKDSVVKNKDKKNRLKALILTPTRELTLQVAEEINSLKFNEKIKTIPIYGGQNIKEQYFKLDKGVDIIVGTPGRILDHLNRKTLDLTGIKFLVLDEVDRMFDMGFQKDVEKIIYECPKNRQTMLFSATISQEIDYLSKKHTNNPKEISVKSHLDSTKLKQILYDVPTNLKFSLLIKLLKNEKSKLVIVFCGSRRTVDFITRNLTKQKIYTNAIHGGMAQNKRKTMLEGFHKNKVDVLVCTDVAARGLDISNVSHVYNYDIPKTKDEYIHRIGRTARAENTGIAINLLSNRDYDNFRKINGGEKIEIERKELPYIEQIEIKKGLNSGRRFSNQRGNRNSRNQRGRSNRGFSNNRDSRSNRGSKNNRSSNNQRDRRPRRRTQ
jgi:ATP-dependent RNA helicase DeaD